MTAALAVTLLAPMPPLLFMGEEWGSTQPFPFFCDFHGRARGRGARRAGARNSRPPMPSSATRFPIRSRKRRFARPCSIGSARDARGRKRLALVRDLLAIRRREIVPRLAQARFGSGAMRRPCADRRLVARRRRAAQAARQSVGRRARTARAAFDRCGRSGAAMPRAACCRRGPCSGASEPADGACHSARHLSPAAHAAVRLRRRRPRIVPYLKSLGISHLYASPFLKARAGSTHGYDVVDHNALNPELGGEAGVSAADRCARSRRISGSFSISCRTTWASTTPTIRGGSTCWNGDRNRPMRASFDIDWETLPAHPRGRRADSDPRKLLRRGARARRDRAALRCRRGQLLGLVLRASAADRSEPLWRNPAKGRGRGGRRR